MSCLNCGSPLRPYAVTVVMSGNISAALRGDFQAYAAARHRSSNPKRCRISNIHGERYRFSIPLRCRGRYRSHDAHISNPNQQGKDSRLGCDFDALENRYLRMHRSSKARHRASINAKRTSEFLPCNQNASTSASQPLAPTLPKLHQP